MAFDPVCNVDLPSITFQVTPQYGLNILSVNNGQHCIAISNSWSIGSMLVIQYDQFYSQQSMCFDITIAISNNTKFLHGSIQSGVIFDYIYKIVRGNKIGSRRRERFSTILLTDEKYSKKGFYIHNGYGSCANEETDESRYIRMGFPDKHKTSFMKMNCKSFKQTNRQLVHESGKCVAESNGYLYLIKCRYVTVPIDWDGTQLKLNGEDSMIFRNDRAYASDKYSTDGVFRDYNINFGLTKESATSAATSNKLRISDIITIIDTKDMYYICVLSNMRSQTVYVMKTGEIVKVMPQIKTLLAYDVQNSALYCTDHKQNIVRVKNNKLKTFSLNKWQVLQTRFNTSLIYSKSIKRNDLINSTVGISAKATVTYIGLYEEQKHILIWPRDTYCATNVGVNNYTALKSCNEVKRVCPDVKSRIYWVTKSYGDNSFSGKVYCDMEFDNGGWMLIVNHTVNNSQPVNPIPYTESLFEVVQSNYTKIYTSEKALRKLYDLGTIINIRFYCTTLDYNRTFHTSSIQNNKGINFIHYFMQNQWKYTSACGTFVVYDDDNSVLNEFCDKFFFYNGRLITRPFFRSNYHYDITRNACDSPRNNVLKHGNWKVYVQNV